MGAPADLDNPKPAEGDLMLPMPQNVQMAFRPVPIGKGENPFFLYRFEMGDPDGDFRENPTQVGVGGAFVDQQQGWRYYLGKYEVSEAQYYSVMESGSPGERSSRYPRRNISWFEAQEFIHKYNLWLFSHARDRLPQCGGTPGFLRLPTEVEWEFAARGGIGIASPKKLTDKHPYTGDLSQYEWFSGPSSSHDKVQPIGALAPNPLFLHDMLGNVAEMTSSLYQVEYYQGRVGGFVARGGHYGTAEETMRAALRAEQPFYDRKLQPQRSQTLGMRLAISCIIFTGLDTASLKQNWDEWRGSRTGQESPAASSTAPPATLTNIKLVEVDSIVQQILGDAALSQDTRRQLEIVWTSFGNIEATVKQAEVDQALAWVRMATTRGLQIAKLLKSVDPVRRTLAVAKGSSAPATISSLQKNLDQLMKDIDTTLHEYDEILAQLQKFEKDSREQAFTQHRRDLTRTNNTDQIRILNDAVQKHLQQYPKGSAGGFAQWKADLEKF
jgi:formylglycine-generating enzyme required for sulfatase activity